MQAAVFGTKQYKRPAGCGRPIAARCGIYKYFGQEELEAGESFATSELFHEEIFDDSYLEQLQQEIDDVGQMIENYGDTGQLTEDYGDTGQLTENISTEGDLNNKREQGNKIKNNCINK